MCFDLKIDIFRYFFIDFSLDILLKNTHTHIYIYRYTVMAKNIGTLGKYDQRRLWKLICIVNPFALLFKKITKI